MSQTAQGEAPLGQRELRLWQVGLTVGIGAYLILGLLASRWISLAEFDDPFVFGRSFLWNALDPAALSLGDTLLFMSRQPVEHYAHPGLTMDLLNGLWIHAAYLSLRALNLTSDDYLTHVVRHHRLYFLWCSFASAALFALTIWPLFRITELTSGGRRSAYAVCLLYLGSVPVILFVNRFSPEPYVIAFGYCAIWLLLAPAPRRTAWLGLTTSMSLLAKPLLLALVPLSLYVSSREKSATPTWRRLSAYALCLVAPAIILFGLKANLGNFMANLLADLRENRHESTLWATVGTPHQRPMLWSQATLLLLAGVGALVWSGADRTSPRTPARRILLGLTALSLVALARRPYWHYLLCISPALQILGLEGMRRLLPRRLGGTNVGLAALALFVVTWGWQYPNLYTTFKHYSYRYALRSGRAAAEPLSLPALWEKRCGNSDLSEIWPTHTRTLQDVLMRLRSSTIQCSS